MELAKIDTDCHTKALSGVSVLQHCRLSHQGSVRSVSLTTLQTVSPRLCQECQSYIIADCLTKALSGVSVLQHCRQLCQVQHCRLYNIADCLTKANGYVWACMYVCICMHVCDCQESLSYNIAKGSVKRANWDDTWRLCLLSATSYCAVPPLSKGTRSREHVCWE